MDGLHSPELVSRVGSVVTFKPTEKASRTKAKVVTVKGLRIRMGVATGWLPAAAEIKTSALFDLAKGELLLECPWACRSISSCLLGLDSLTLLGWLRLYAVGFI